HGRPVREGGPFLSPVLPDEGDEETLDEDEDRDREDRDEEVAVADPVRVRRFGCDGCELCECRGAGDRGDGGGAGRSEETSHRLPFYERAGGVVPGNARAATCRRRAAVR